MVAVTFEPGRGQRVPVLTWGRDPDPAAVRQLQRIASQPWAVDQVAGMPDLHVSDGVAVGTVFATEHHVVPGALGGDLGCGMAALRFRAHAPDLDRRALGRLMAAIARRVPVGDETHRSGIPIPDEIGQPELSTSSLCRERDRLGPRHLGTLGGGNHFVELDADAGGALWLLVHTGSRGLGAAIRKHHQAAAEAQDPGPLAALDTRTDAGRGYLADLTWALAFARHNRARILEAAAAVLAEEAGVSPEMDTLVDIHHNHAAHETHGGRELLVHRKGAIGAAAGRQALVPGSMGTASYLVEGLGEPRSFASCSHGAGRVLRRSEARATVSPAQLEREMRHVVFDHRKTGSLVEEAPSAYRDIREVLEDESDLATPLLRLEPLAVLKG
jgi:tRNA-splicing ligase RtcB